MASGTVPITLPLGGLDRSTEFQRAAPYTSPGLLNVRPRDPFTKRIRLGSRPGLSRITDLVGNTPIAMLATVRPPSRLATGTVFDQFQSDTQPTIIASAPWSQPGWTNHPDALYSMPHIFSPTLGARLYVNSTNSTQKAAAALRDAITGLDPAASPYTVSIKCAPDYNSWASSGALLPAYTGIFYLWAAMSNTAPDPEQNCAFIAAFPWYPNVYVYTLTYGYYASGVLTQFSTTISVSPTVAAPFVLSMTLNLGVVTCYLNGTSFGSFTMAAGQAGQRIGVGITGRADTNADHLFIDEFSVSYGTGAATNAPTESLVAIGSGGLYYESAPNVMSLYSAAPYTLRLTPPVDATERAGQLFIADYLTAPIAAGTSGTVSGTFPNRFSDGATNWITAGTAVGDILVISAGSGAAPGTYLIVTVTSGFIALDRPPGPSTGIIFSVERPPKVWNPALASASRLKTWTATAGSVPFGCPLIMLYQDAMFLGAPYYAPNEYFASKQGDGFDWDFSQIGINPGSAFAGSDTDLGVIPGAMTAMFAHANDFGVFATGSTIHVMRGHPLHGGAVFAALSRVLGIVDQRAWCQGPGGEMYVMTRKGVAMIDATGQSISLLSKGPLPAEFQGILYGAGGLRCCMIYDIAGDGVHVFLSPATSGSFSTPSHWWFDLQVPGWWKDSLPATSDPFSVCHHDLPPSGDRASLLGCRDGGIRRYDPFAQSDDGTTISTYVMIGPISLGDAAHSGVLSMIVGTLAERSGDVTWEIYVGETAEAAYNAASAAASPFATSTWGQGQNFNARPRARGNAAVIRLVSTEPWAIESLMVKIEQAGLTRKAS